MADPLLVPVVDRVNAGKPLARVAGRFCGTHTPLQRFCAKVKLPDTPDGCWEWLGGRSVSGYGRFGLSDRGESKVAAHRYSYERFVGPIPDGLTIDHLCRNIVCVNPAHLEAVSGRVNTLRGFAVSAINAAKTHCKNGHELTGANLYHWRGKQRQCKACGRTRKRAAYRKAASEQEGKDG